MQYIHFWLVLSHQPLSLSDTMPLVSSWKPKIIINRKHSLESSTKDGLLIHLNSLKVPSVFMQLIHLPCIYMYIIYMYIHVLGSMLDFWK